MFQNDNLCELIMATNQIAGNQLFIEFYLQKNVKVVYNDIFVKQTISFNS